VCLSETHQQLGEQLGEDIIGMVRKACDPDKVDAWQNGFWVLTQTELERFASRVAAAATSTFRPLPPELLPHSRRRCCVCA
jgi:hypothetical protein